MEDGGARVAQRVVGALLPAALGHDEGVRDVRRVVHHEPDGEHLVGVPRGCSLRHMELQPPARGAAGWAWGGLGVWWAGCVAGTHQVDDGDAVDGEPGEPHEAEDVHVDHDDHEQHVERRGKIGHRQQHLGTCTRCG